MSAFLRAAAFSALVLINGCSGGEEKKAADDAAPAPPAEVKPAVQKITGDPASGEKIYTTYCHFCHGQKGYGDGPVGLALSPHPADFVNDEKRMSKTDEELFLSITQGIHKQVGGEAMAMPRWQDILSDQERWDVLSYIRKLSREGREAQKKN